jgi:hypothetical protein
LLDAAFDRNTCPTHTIRHVCGENSYKPKESQNCLSILTAGAIKPEPLSEWRDRPELVQASPGVEHHEQVEQRIRSAREGSGRHLHERRLVLHPLLEALAHHHRHLELQCLAGSDVHNAVHKILANEVKMTYMVKRGPET